jgi:hypothetical protein
MGINYSILTILALFILLILKILIALLIKEKRRVCSNTSKKDLKMKTLKLNYLVTDSYVLYKKKKKVNSSHSPYKARVHE